MDGVANMDLSPEPLEAPVASAVERKRAAQVRHAALEKGQAYEARPRASGLARPPRPGTMRQRQAGLARLGTWGQRRAGLR